MYIDAITLANIINDQLHTIFVFAQVPINRFIFHLLGPPSIGKTFVQEYLFDKWTEYQPCFLHVTSFVIPRTNRLLYSFSECLEESYDLNTLENTIKSLLSGKIINIPLSIR